MLKKLSVKAKMGIAFTVVLIFMAVVAIEAITGLGKVVNNAKEVVSAKNFDQEMTQRELDHVSWVSALRHNIEHSIHANISTDPEKRTRMIPRNEGI